MEKVHYTLEKSALYGYTCLNELDSGSRVKFWLCSEVVDLLLKGADLERFVLEVSTSGTTDEGDYRLSESIWPGPEEGHKLWRINGNIYVELQYDARVRLEAQLKEWDVETVFFRFLKEVVVPEKIDYEPIVA